MAKKVTVEEVRSAYPEVKVISVPASFYKKLPETQSVWVMLYRWLQSEHGITEGARLDLHNRSAAGDVLMKKLDAAENARLRKRFKITGAKLKSALGWSNMNSGPHGLIDGRKFVGDELVVFPEGDVDPANCRLK